MAVPRNPIDLSKVSYPEYEVEARVQSILKLWLKFYFSGVPFTALDCDGNEVEDTFSECGFLFNQGKSEDQPKVKTVIHWALADDRSEDCVVGAKKVVTDSLVWNVYVKTSGNYGCRDSENENRRVASQLKWLMGSSEVQALVMVGLQRLNVRRGPMPIASRDSFVRQFIVEVKADYCVARNVGVDGLS